MKATVGEGCPGQTGGLAPDVARRLAGRESLLAPRAADLGARHGPFWTSREEPQPLVGIFRQDMLPMSRFVEHIGEGEITPARICPQDWLHLYEETFQRTGLLWGDLVWWASPLNGFPWVEAIAGCQVYASRTTGSAWAGPHPALSGGLTASALDQVLRGLTVDPANPWLLKLLECTRTLAYASGGRFPVAPGIMRGASDLVAALLGQEQFCLTLYDQPEAVAAMVERSTQLWLEVIAAQLECIPPFVGGYVNAGLWAPGPCPVYQEDASVLISSAAFCRFFLPAGRAVWQRYPHAILHLHSAGLHVLPPLLEAPCPPVIEVNLDPAGPPLERLLPAFALVQERTRLEILGTQAQIRTCLARLRPTGAAYLVLEETMEDE